MGPDRQTAEVEKQTRGSEVRKALLTLLAVLCVASGVAWALIGVLEPRLVGAFFETMQSLQNGVGRLGPLAPIARVPLAVVIALTLTPLLGGTVVGPLTTGAIATLGGFALWRWSTRF